MLTDAGIELIDGQCTSIGACTHPAIDTIPVMIVEAAAREDRATAFIGHNRDRVAVTPTQIHVAALVGGDQDALAINRVCEASGATILSMPTKTTYAAGETLAVTAIAALVRLRGEDGAAAVLRCLVSAGCAPMTQLHIKAADLLLHNAEYSREIDAEKLATVIIAMGPKIGSDAKVFVAAHPSTPLWKAMAIVWFRNRRGSKAVTSPTVPAASPSSGGAVPHSEPPSDLKTASGKFIEKIEHRSANPIAVKRQAAPVADNGKRDARPKLSGWMPGVFLLRCSACDEKYQGDRKSRSCADCAYGCREAVSA